MRSKAAATICGLVVFATPLAAIPQEPSEWNKEVVSIVNGDVPLAGYLYRPEGEGPFPTLLFNHGSAPGSANDQAFDLIGPYFAEKGWAVLAPYRRGQGLSSEAAEYVGDQIRAARLDRFRRSGPLVMIIALVLAVTAGVLMRRHRVWLRVLPIGAIAVVGVTVLYVASMNAGAKAMVQVLSTEHLADHIAALDWLQDQNFVDKSRIATGGNSFGGIVTVFAIQEVPFCAAFSAGGGAQSWSAASELRRRMQEAVDVTRAPLLFFQAANDYSLAPSEVLGELRPTTGQPVDRIIFPAYGTSDRDGHAFGWRGVSEWGPDLLEFLSTNCD